MLFCHCSGAQSAYYALELVCVCIFSRENKRAREKSSELVNIWESIAYAVAPLIYVRFDGLILTKLKFWSKSSFYILAGSIYERRDLIRIPDYLITIQVWRELVQKVNAVVHFHTPTRLILYRRWDLSRKNIPMDIFLVFIFLLSYVPYKLDRIFMAQIARIDINFEIIAVAWKKTHTYSARFTPIIWSTSLKVRG